MNQNRGLKIVQRSDFIYFFCEFCCSVGVRHIRHTHSLSHAANVKVMKMQTTVRRMQLMSAFVRGEMARYTHGMPMECHA